MGLFSKKSKPGRSSRHDEAAERGDTARAIANVSRALTPAKPRRGRLVVYGDAGGAGWRWRLIAPNGKITADSGEAYVHRFDAKIAALRLADVASAAKLEVHDR